jgi:hypothetical protein
MDKNFLILAHQSPQQLKRLIHRLDDHHSFFYLHIDLKSDLSAFESILSAPNIMFLKKRVNALWGNYSLVEATLNGINQIISDGKTGFVILLSGQDYPLKGNDALTDYLQKHISYNFIDLKSIEDAWPREYVNKSKKYYVNVSHKKGDGLFISYFRDISKKNLLKTSFRLFKNSIRHKNPALLWHILKSFKERIPPVPAQYGGSQWWALNMDTLVKIVEFLRLHSHYLNYHRFTYVPDEIFFHTVIKFLQDHDSEILIKPSLTYVNWQRHNHAYPAVFTLDDVEELFDARSNEKFFARKFESDSCGPIQDLLDLSIDSTQTPIF